MATVTLTRGNTLPDSGTKTDLHNLIDLATASVTNIVNADISASAAIAGTKVSPSFGAQDITTTGDVTATNCDLSGDVTISGTTDIGGALSCASMASLLVTSDPTGSPTANTLYKGLLVKGWVNFDGSGGSVSVNDSFNVASVAYDSTGRYTITWDTDFADANYAIAGSAFLTGQSMLMTRDTSTPLAAGTSTVGTVVANTGTHTDCPNVFVMAIGNQ